jgi:hypothetical protein
LELNGPLYSGQTGKRRVNGFHLLEKMTLASSGVTARHC